MNYHRLRWLILLTFQFLFGIGKAQEDSTEYCAAACCNIDPTPSGVMISLTHSKHELMVSYRFMRMGMGNLISGSAKIAHEQVFQQYLMSSSTMHMDMHMLMAMYGLSNRFTLMGMIQYQSNFMRMKMLPGSAHSHTMGGVFMDNTSMNTSMDMNSSGFGDTKLYVLFSLLNTTHHHVVLNAGFSMPTGSIQKTGNKESMYAGQRLPYGMQSGSGTWDILPGISWLLRSGDVTASTQLLPVIRTGRNSAGYRHGNELTSNTWIAYQWLYWLSSSFRIEGNLTGSMNGEDASIYRNYEPAANALNYGSKKLTGLLGLKIFLPGILAKNTSIGAEYGLPIYQYVQGIQMRTKSVLNLSLNAMF